ncbi:uncharacterized protein LOC135691401 [Rhopilema esculentum]|uniref:uncharacterized protein LOC135691401 n=1 Tax=Rhopilema esculentum TaxID=499914 RepID=UPI0031E09F7D
MGCNIKYLRSSLAAVKFIELLSLSAAIATVAFFNWEVKIEGTTFSRIQFFLFVTIVAWIVELIVFIMILTRCTKNLPVPWPLVNIVFAVVFGVFVLIATGMLSLSVASMMTTTKQWPTNNRDWQTITYCEFINRTQSKTSCLAIQGGAAFGLLCFVIFIVDIFINSKELRSDVYLHGPTQEKTIDKDTLTATTVVKETHD